MRLASATNHSQALATTPDVLPMEAQEWTRRLEEPSPTPQLLKEAKSFFTQRLAPLRKSYRHAEQMPLWMWNFECAFSAARLGIPSQVLKAYPDFKAFAEANYLASTLLFFANPRHHRRAPESRSALYHTDHEVLVIGGMPHLLFHGAYMPWTFFRALIRDQVLQLHPNGRMANAAYVRQGIQIEKKLEAPTSLHLLSPEELENLLVDSFVLFDEFDHDDSWTFHLVTEALPSPPRWQGDHGSGRLITPNGFVFSFGDYRQEFKMTRQLATLHMPEDGEFYTMGGSVWITAFRVQQEVASRLFALLHTKRHTARPYDTVDANCCSTMLDFVNVVCDSYPKNKVTMHFWEYFFPERYRHLKENYPCTQRLLNVSGHLVMYAAMPGFRQITSELQQALPDEKPYFSSFSEVFRQDKVCIMPSAHAIQKVQKTVWKEISWEERPATGQPPDGVSLRTFVKAAAKL